MTEAEAASAFDVTVEAGAQWTVELTGTNYANALQVQAQKAADVTSAQDAKRAADDAVTDRGSELAGLDAILQAEISGLQTLEQALSEAVTRQGEAQTNANQAQQAYDTAFEAAEIQALTFAPDPDDLVAGESVVATTLTAPNGETIEAGDIWSAEAITILTALRDSFINDFSLTTQDPTVSQLARGHITQNLLLDANSDVAGRRASRNDQSDERDEAQDNYDDKYAELTEAQNLAATRASELEGAEAAKADADDDVAAAIVTLTGTGTGSAETISLDSDDLDALGDGQVTGDLNSDRCRWQPEPRRVCLLQPRHGPSWPAVYRLLGRGYQHW